MELTTSKEIGIYCIHNRSNDFVYFGSAANARGFRGRQMRHISDLNKSKHHSWILQRDWKRYSPDVFDFHIVEVCSREQCADFERNWISIRGVGESNKSYNISKDCFPPSDSPRGCEDWIITYPDGKQIEITNLEKFCRENKLDASHMGAVATGKEPHHKGFICDYKDVIKQEEAKLKRTNTGRSYTILPKRALFISPDNIEYIVESQGITKFARELKLDASCFNDLAKGTLLTYKKWEGGYINEEGIYLKEVMDNKLDIFNRNFRSYKFSYNNKIVETTNLNTFAIETGISLSMLYKMLRNTEIQFKGWNAHVKLNTI